MAASPLRSRGAQKMAELQRKPNILGGPQLQARVANQEWLPHPYLVGGPKERGIATEPTQLSPATPPPHLDSLKRFLTSATRVRRNLCTIGCFDIPAHGTNHGKNIAKKLRRRLKEGVQ